MKKDRFALFCSRLLSPMLLPRMAPPIAAGVLSLGLLLGGDSVLAQPGESDAQAELPLSELRLFAEVLDHIRVAYVEEVTDTQLLESAIEGMLAGLDPHSAYLNAESFADLQASTTGSFGGLGLEVGMEDGFVKVISPIDDTPAAKAGIEAGDLIIKLDNQPVRGLSLNEAVKIMRGERGSSIELTILRNGLSQPFTITVVRDIIKVVSVRSRVLEPGYVYLRVAQFQSSTGEELAKEVRKRQAEYSKTGSHSDLQGIVLDLRNNPGGVLQSSVDVADIFLNGGLIVYTEGRLPTSKTRYAARAESQLTQCPLVVLINGGSASASEIVAGALQDHKRAIIMGTDSFGKGSVQTVIPLNKDRAIKLTTARYYTPNGRSIQAQGIVPDIVVERAKITPLQVQRGVSESDLSGHLDNTDKAGGRGKQAAGDAEQGDNLGDNQVYEALNLLKGIRILSLQQNNNTNDGP